MAMPEAAFYAHHPSTTVPSSLAANQYYQGTGGVVVGPGGLGTVGGGGTAAGGGPFNGSGSMPDWSLFGQMDYSSPVTSSTSDPSSSTTNDVDMMHVSTQPNLIYSNGQQFFMPFDNSAMLMHQQQQHDGLLSTAPPLLQSCAQSSLSIPSTSFLPFGGSMPGQQPLSHHPSHTAVHHMHGQQPPPRQMASSSTTTSASDSCSQIAHVLMCYQQGGEEPEFVRKAIESLVKKLKDKRMELEALITAVTSAGKTPTCCVTIQRSLDGRLQVAGRKGVPHVVYARIWRWPNIAKTELQKLPICQIPSDNQDFICINPYHYERVVSCVGVMDLKRSDSGPSFSGGCFPTQSVCMDEMNVPNDDLWQSSLPRGAANAIQNDLLGSSPLFGGEPGMIRNQSIDLSRVQIPPAPHYPSHWCTINYYELDTQIGDSFKVRRDMMQITIDGGMDPQGERAGRYCIGALPNVHRSPASEKARMHVGAGVSIRQHADGRVTAEVRSNKPVFVRAPFIDYQKRMPYGTTVHRLTNGDAEITIFDLRWAYAEMLEQTTSAKEAVVAQARAVAGLPVLHPGLQQISDVVAGSGVDEMKRVFCSVGMSFVKGWGSGYNRQTMKECPCWIEIQLHRPLQLLDQLLKRSYI